MPANFGPHHLSRWVPIYKILIKLSGVRRGRWNRHFTLIFFFFVSLIAYVQRARWDIAVLANTWLCGFDIVFESCDGRDGGLAGGSVCYGGVCYSLLVLAICVCVPRETLICTFRYPLIKVNGLRRILLSWSRAYVSDPYTHPREKHGHR